MNNPKLIQAISVLPTNYNFEIQKTIWRLQSKGSKRAGLQFPEGLLAYSCIISDILEEFAGVETVIMGDVTYGACCVDDFTARALGCDFLVHYGHSCLVPIQTTTINTLYVFVDIKIDVQHFIDTVKFNFPEPSTNIVLVGTIQFASSLYAAKQELIGFYPSISVPQARPLSPGEILGCTSPKLGECDVLVYLADGRFHLESIMISNPSVPAYQYDPFTKTLIRQYYQFEKMLEMRSACIEKAKDVKFVGIVLGTLGRQGSLDILERIQSNLSKKNIQFITVLLSEIFPEKLDSFGVGAWIQIACPRLSIDWGYAFSTPLLNPYEAEVAFGEATWSENSYPMDFYSNEGGPWSVYAHKQKNKDKK
eukprot:TRINITY_DN11531_c0_g1_i1.p1 TRINITY_DN11531_c0_g1~~TRINITY_DN11531_c0_g1_i1.p1  ORF type:complete len:411 (+),score=68.32 TRINITY_DN11531_c0_g1_i1:140-1234(+)